MTTTAVGCVRWIQFWHHDDNGVLRVFQGNDRAGVPFPIARVFTVSGVPGGASRANHAHRDCTQLLVCLMDEVEVHLRDTDGNTVVHRLKDDGRGLLIPPLHWNTVKFASPSTVLMVICDKPYDDADYIRDWNEYVRLRDGATAGSRSGAAGVAEANQAALWPVMAEIYQRTFGFVDSHPPYKIWYPWIAARLSGLAPGSRILDVGAGISAMPLFFAERGHRVDTVDSSRRIRRLPADETWSGWGFFDYCAVHRNISSYNCDISDYAPVGCYDAVYSAGMMAFLPSAARQGLLRKLALWLVPGGRLTFTMDVVKATDFIWNKCAGQVVEPLEAHGTIQDLDGELRDVGYRIVACEVVRDQPESRADFVLVDCIAPDLRS